MGKRERKREQHKRKLTPLSKAKGLRGDLCVFCRKAPREGTYKKKGRVVPYSRCRLFDPRTADKRAPAKIPWVKELTEAQAARLAELPFSVSVPDFGVAVVHAGRAAQPLR
jgi:hypothetical protein